MDLPENHFDTGIPYSSLHEVELHHRIDTIEAQAAVLNAEGTIFSGIRHE